MLSRKFNFLKILFFIRILVNARVWIPPKKWEMFYRLSSLRWQRCQELPRLRDSPNMNDMILFSALFWHNRDMSAFTDKIQVRDFIQDAIGSSYLSNVTQVAESIDDIDFAAARGKWIKSNNGSGFNVFHDGILSDFEIKKRLSRSTQPYGVAHGEYVYRFIKPKFFVESPVQGLSNSRLIEFKGFFHFGKLLGIWLKTGRGNVVLSPNLELDFEDLSNGNTLNQSLNVSEILDASVMNEAIELGVNCTKSFHFVRFDLYIISKKILFQELTFLPGAGAVKRKSNLGSFALEVAPKMYQKPKK